MYLKETVMTNSEQQVFFLNISHGEWEQEEMAGVAEGNFDTWLPFIGQYVLKISGVQPR